MSTAKERLQSIQVGKKAKEDHHTWLARCALANLSRSQRTSYGDGEQAPARIFIDAIKPEAYHGAMNVPKYALLEIERRWNVHLDRVGPLEQFPAQEIEDLYVEGTRLRLRRMTQADGGAVYKFCKKYGTAGTIAEPITNLYLKTIEWEVLRHLPGKVVRKRRYALREGALDVYDLSGTAIFSVEFKSEADAEAYLPPEFAKEEVTLNPAYSGSALAAQQGSRE